jgi:hypothetical protein
MKHTRMMLLALASTLGCSSDGQGTVQFRVSGEDGALGGFPNDEAAFVDGWALQFDRYLVSIADVTVGARDGGSVHGDEQVYIADLHAAEPELDEIGPIGARRWDAVSWDMRAPTADDEVVALDGVTEADVAMMRDGELVYYIAGRATKEMREVTFAWGLANPVHQSDCTNGVDGTDGVVVRNNAASDAEITIHVEHAFWDSLGTEESALRFDPIAALADADGVVTWDALAGARLSELQDEDGNPLVYNPGSLPLSNLQEFILAATRTQAHLGGEGLCTIEPL